MTDTPSTAPAPAGDGSGGVDVLEDFRRFRDSGDRRLRNQLVERHMHLVEPYVRRFDRKGMAPEDLRQVALIAVLRAVERFDPDYGVAFSTFAGRTIEGELMRLLRDRGWAVRPPRRQQELFLALRRREDELIQRLGRSPTVSELARALGESEDHVLEALEAGGARHGSSIDQPSGADRPAVELADPTAAGTARVETRLLITQLLEGLDEREREVVRLRFFEELGQPEIAERLGLSQSYVSRLIRQILESMRARLEAAGASPDDAP